MEWVNGRSLKNRIKMSRVTQVFCNSKFTKNYIDNNFGIISELLYPPIENKVKNLPKENIILTVGRFGITNEGTNYKKHDVLIKSFKKWWVKKLRIGILFLLSVLGRKTQSVSKITVTCGRVSHRIYYKSFKPDIMGMVLKIKNLLACVWFW